MTLQFIALRRGHHPRRAGAIMVLAHGGTNRIQFLARVSRLRRLDAERYRLVVIAANPEGQSVPAVLTFAVVQERNAR